MKKLFISFCATGLITAVSFTAMPVMAQDAQPENPVVDRIVFKKKKKKPAEAPPPPNVAQPAPIAPPPIVAVPPAPQEATSASGPGRVGDAMVLGFSAGSKNRVQLGYSNWLNSMIGYSVQASYRMEHNTKSITLSSGPRRVNNLAYTVSPEASFFLGSARNKDLRLYLETGGGIEITKEDRKKLQLRDPVSGWQVFTGPGIEWHLAAPFAIQVGERLIFASSRLPIPHYGFEMATQLSAAWWFQ